MCPAMISVFVYRFLRGGSMTALHFVPVSKSGAGSELILGFEEWASLFMCWMKRPSV